MWTSTWALFNRSFRSDARSVPAHALRLLFAVVVLFALIEAHQLSLIFAAPGLHVFEWISWLNFLLITIAGIGFFTTAITEEKEEQSLGLLKMAGISPIALLLGKSTTGMLSMLLVLAVQFPFVLLSITLGGVTLRQVFAMMAAEAAHLVFVANLGLAFSVFCSTTRRATSLMMLTMAVLLIVLPIYATITPPPGAISPLAQVFAPTVQEAIKTVTILFRLNKILATGFAESPLSWQVITNLALGAGLFVVAWITFERFTSDRPPFAWLMSLWQRHGKGKTRKGTNRSWKMAMFWKDFYFITGGIRGALARTGVYVAIIMFLSVMYLSVDASGRLNKQQIVGEFGMDVALFAVAIELGLFAARVFGDEVKGQTLSLLMMLPRSTAQTAWEKALAALPALVPSVGLFVLGALINPRIFHDNFVRDLAPDKSPMLFFITCYFLGLHLTAYLSLWVKWVALPLAAVLTVLLQCFIIGFVGPVIFKHNIGPSDNILGFLDGTWIFAMFVLQVLIGQRLRTLAAR